MINGTELANELSEKMERFFAWKNKALRVCSAFYSFMNQIFSPSLQTMIGIFNVEFQVSLIVETR